MPTVPVAVGPPKVDHGMGGRYDHPLQGHQEAPADPDNHGAAHLWRRLKPASVTDDDPETVTAPSRTSLRLASGCHRRTDISAFLFLQFSSAEGRFLNSERSGFQRKGQERKPFPFPWILP